MEKLIELNTDPNILVSSNIIDAEKPDYVYIPIFTNSKVLIHQNDSVSIGTPITKSETKTETSSVSGRVTAIKKIKTLNGDLDAVEIMNDFKERRVVEVGSIRSLNKLAKEKTDNALKMFQIDVENKTNLILNAIDDEPYILNSCFYLFDNQTDFLELLDKLARTYNIKNTIIAIKSTNSNSINELMNKLGSFPNIHLHICPNFYLLGQEEFLLKNLGLTSIDSTIIEAREFYYLNNFLKKQQNISDKYLTISGDNIERPSVIKVKLGSRVENIIKENTKVLNNSVYFANGLMKGHQINLQDLIVTPDLEGIIIMKERPDIKSTKCLNCGACIDICPRNLNPRLLKNKKYQELVKNKCLKCGLCSYICPSHIEFNIDYKGE